MFNLLVKSGGWDERGDWLPADRVFEHTAPSLVEKFKPGGELAHSLVQALPTLFVPEVAGGSDTYGRVGTIVGFRASNERVGIDYVYDPVASPIEMSEVQELSSALDINRFELNRTHWAIKDVDLFDVLSLEPSNDPATAGVPPAQTNPVEREERDNAPREGEVTLSPADRTLLSRSSAVLAAGDPRAFERVVSDVITRMRRLEDSEAPASVRLHAAVAASSLEVVKAAWTGDIPESEGHAGEEALRGLVERLATLGLIAVYPEVGIIIEAGRLLLDYLRSQGS